MNPHEIQVVVDNENRPVMENNEVLVFNKTGR